MTFKHSKQPLETYSKISNSSEPGPAYRGAIVYAAYPCSKLPQVKSLQPMSAVPPTCRLFAGFSKMWTCDMSGVKQPWEIPGLRPAVKREERSPCWPCWPSHLLAKMLEDLLGKRGIFARNMNLYSMTKCLRQGFGFLPLCTATALTLAFLCWFKKQTTTSLGESSQSLWTSVSSLQALEKDRRTVSHTFGF